MPRTVKVERDQAVQKRLTVFDKAPVAEPRWYGSGA